MSFEQDIAKSVQKYAPQFDIIVYSPIIAQAILESTYGTSFKATHHNYFGLKTRDNRCPSSDHIFTDTSKEEYEAGKLKEIVTTWFGFPSLDIGVKGYFEFINISSYIKTKNQSDPKKYLQALKDAKYATSVNYVNNVMNVVQKLNLTKYDPKTPANNKVIYRVQVGAYSLQKNAIAMQNTLKANAINSIIVPVSINSRTLYRVQVGAYAEESNAIAMQRALQLLKIDSIIVKS